MGADLIALRRLPTKSAASAVRLENAILAVVTLMVLGAIWGATVAKALSKPVRISLVLSGLAVVGLVRDAATSYRQQRRAPRVSYESRGYGDLLELSPNGYVIHTGDKPGSLRKIEIDLALPDQRTKRLTLSGVVQRSRKRSGEKTAFVEFDARPEEYADLYYFCAVTAPTIRWMGGSARIAVEQRRSTVPMPT